MPKAKQPDAHLLALDTEFLDEVAVAGSLDLYAAQRGITKRSASNHLDRVRGRVRDYPELYTDILAKPERADIVSVKKEKISDPYLVTLVQHVETLLSADPDLRRDKICGHLGKELNKAPETIANNITRARKRYQAEPELFDPMSDATIRYLEEGGNIPDRRLIDFAKDYEETGNLDVTSRKLGFKASTARKKIHERTTNKAFMAKLAAAVTPETLEKLSNIEDRLKPQELYPLLEQIVTYPTQVAAATGMNMAVPKVFDIIDRGRKGYQENPDYFGCPVSDDIKSLLTEYDPVHKFSDEEHRNTLDTILEHRSVKAATAQDGKPWRGRLRHVRVKAEKDPAFLASLNAPQRELTLYGLGIDNKPFSWQIRSIMEVASVVGVNETSKLLGYNRKSDFVTTLRFWQTLGEKHPELNLTPDLFAIDELHPRHQPHPGHEKVLIAAAQSGKLVDAAATFDVKPATFYKWFRETRIELQKPGMLDRLDWGLMADKSQGQIKQIDDVLGLLKPRQHYSPTFTVSDLVDFAHTVAAASPKSLYQYARDHEQDEKKLYYKDFILKGLIQLGVMQEDDIPEGYPDVKRFSKSSAWMKTKALNTVALVGHYEETAKALNTDPSTVRYRALAALTQGFEISSGFDQTMQNEQQKLLARGPEEFPAEPMLWLVQSPEAPPSVIFAEPFQPALTLRPGITTNGLYEITCTTSPHIAHTPDTKKTVLARGHNAWQAWDMLGKTLTELELSDKVTDAAKAPGDIIEAALCQIGKSGFLRPFRIQGTHQSLPIDPLAQEITTPHHEAGYSWYGPQYQHSAIRYQSKSPGAAAVLALSKELGGVIDPVSAQDFADAAARMGRTIPEEALSLAGRLENWRDKNRARRQAPNLCKTA